jgi:glycine cleavage system aminomethyltransferase T
LTCIEDLTQTDLHDLKFLQFRKVTIPGLDCADIIVERIGMSGTLSYELRGPAEIATEAYDAFYQLGKAKYGMKRLGWRTYTVNHTEGGFPQWSVHWLAAMLFPEYDAEYCTQFYAAMFQHTGSCDPADHRARVRTPFEVGWGWMAKFNHDFIGRAALEAEAANPKRTIVTLEWSSEDVADIYASQFCEGEPYKYMEMPSAPQQPTGGHADRVLNKDGKLVGISSCAIYSAYCHKTISHCTIDVAEAEIGNEVLVEWGDFGGKIKQVRATVQKFPYISLIRNENYDLASVPQGFQG